MHQDGERVVQGRMHQAGRGSVVTNDMGGKMGFKQRATIGKNGSNGYHSHMHSKADGAGVNLKKLPQYDIRSFESSRYSGYEVETGVPYLMFDSSELFEQKLSKTGRAVAKQLNIDNVRETEWTVYSY